MQKYDLQIELIDFKDHSTLMQGAHYDINVLAAHYLIAVRIVWRTPLWIEQTVLDLIKARPQPSPTDSSLLIAPKIKPQIVGQPSHLARQLFKKSCVSPIT